MKWPYKNNEMSIIHVYDHGQTRRISIAEGCCESLSYQLV